MTDMNRAQAYQRHATAYPLDELRLEICAVKDGKWISVQSTDLVFAKHRAADFDSVLNLIYAAHYLDMSMTHFRWELWHQQPKSASKDMLATGIVIIPVAMKQERCAKRGDVVTWAYTRLLSEGLNLAQNGQPDFAAAAGRLKTLGVKSISTARPNDIAEQASAYALSAMRVWDQDLHGDDPWLKDDWAVGRDGELIDCVRETSADKAEAEEPIVRRRPGVDLDAALETAIQTVCSASKPEGISNVAVGYQAEPALPRWAQSFVSIDTETTGLGEDARVLSVAAVVFHRGYVVERWECYLNPEHVDWESESVRGALKVNGLQRYQIQAAAPSEYALRKLSRQLCNADQIGSCYLAGHHLQYDVRMIARELDLAEPRSGSRDSQLREKLANMAMFDTKSLFVAVYGLQERHRLKQICEWMDVPIAAHTAIGDAEAAGHVLVKLARTGKLPLDLNDLLRVQADAEAKWRAAHPEYK